MRLPLDVVDTLSPAELWLYHEAEQERRHDLAELFVWAVFHIVKSMPAGAKGKGDWRKGIKSINDMLEQRPPPGWSKAIARKRQGSVRAVRVRRGS